MSLLWHVALAVVFILGLGMFELGLLVAWYQWTEPIDVDEAN